MKLKALLARYKADKLEALATLEVYMNNSAGIGEHPQILEEMDKLVAKLADADGKIETLQKYIVKEETQSIDMSGAPTV